MMLKKVSLEGMVLTNHSSYNIVMISSNSGAVKATSMQLTTIPVNVWWAASIKK
jgi:hypothetical protein